MIPEAVLNYLKLTYSPKAILLHGSRARGEHFENSDYDIALVVDDPGSVQPHTFEGCALDVFGVSKDHNVLISGQTPISPIEIIFDDSNQCGKKIVEITQAAYVKGPEALSTKEWQNRRSYMGRLIERLKARGDDVLIRNHYIADYFERMVRYWFEKERQWTRSFYLALPHIEKQDPQFHSQLSRLWGVDYRDAVEQTYHSIFTGEHLTFSPKPSIRVAANADSKAITDLIFNIWIHEYGFDVKKSDYPDLQDIETYYDGLFLVADRNGKVLGTIACDPLSDNQFVLKRMFVDAAQRGKGIAQKLLDALFKKVEDRIDQNTTFYLSTKRDEAVAAEKFYLKNGFVEVAKDQLPSNFPFFYEDDLFMMRQR